MDFEVLGPLRVIAGTGELLPVARPLHRATLAVLLLYSGSPCTHWGLAAAVWGDHPPGNPVTALRTEISRIRRDLDLGERLQTLSGGYQMNPRPGELDLHQFRRLHGRAMQVLSQGHRRQAVPLLAQALECWGDPPLADLPHTAVVIPDIEQLLELRYATESHLIDVLLALGHHAEIVADLHRIVAAAPLSERSWAQLMLALYRSGRRSEALAAYSRAREVMIRALGTEPGRELQDLLGKILADSRELDVAVSPASIAARYWPPAGSPLTLPGGHMTASAALPAVRVHWQPHRSRVAS